MSILEPRSDGAAYEPRPNPSGYPGGAQSAVVDRDQARTVFAHTMFLVAATAGFAAIGSYIGRDLSGGASLVCFIIGIALSFGVGVSRRSSPIAMTALFGMGLFLGLGVGPGLAAYAHLPNGGTLIAEAAGATALLVTGLGAYGYASRRDFSSWGRTLMWATIGLLLVGIVLIFTQIPGAHLVWSVVGVGIFSAWTIFDFNRLRRAHPDQAVLIATGIFLDVFNLFLFLLQIFGGTRD